MTEQRAQRVAEEIKREISDILRNEMKDPRASGMISVTDVEVTRDLGHAKIFVSVFGSDEEQDATLATLAKAVGFVRSEIGKRIRLRRTPEISFQLDKSIAYGSHINEILRQIEPTKGEDTSE